MAKYEKSKTIARDKLPKTKRWGGESYLKFAQTYLRCKDFESLSSLLLESSTIFVSYIPIFMLLIET